MASKKSSQKKESGLDLIQLEKLFNLMGKHQMAELEWESAQGRLHVRAQGDYPGLINSVGAAAALPRVQSQMPVTPPASPAAAEAPKALPSNQKQILSPFVGTFYRASSPGAEPYVREGSSVKRGDVLCIIEAMKLMNEIEAEQNGKIVAILAENGQPVEFGEPLFTIEV